MVITGGEYTLRKVTEYNEDGKSKELPQLITGRDRHGCSSYSDIDGNIVTTDKVSLLIAVIGCN